MMQEPLPTWRCVGRSLLAWALAFGVMLPAMADPYPERPIQLIVPFASGGGLDQNARAFGQALSDVLKTPVVVINRDGAAGTIGLLAVAGAKPMGTAWPSRRPYPLRASRTG
jgi:tripartite-type tricarboxylate transporter receptor subunit TctC